ncbi:PerC family transcriptional regulator [Lelliottia wanjuensis]|uniref:PerC family transcriptional regulator n=1 Tax=Lelliottia wanjuensis TaxID=3050585 RepID=UPI002550145F|nr:PerC family transcriptional regulator [Lelliottia sp. V86_10]MDK9583180.1 PerC family transcriptional regulator [Lelliottia sp. V86_10]
MTMTESVSINEAKNLTDTLAEDLERKGLWRRAATRWLEVMYQPHQTDRTRAAAAVRRNNCQRILNGMKPARFTEI